MSYLSYQFERLSVHILQQFAWIFNFSDHRSHCLINTRLTVLNSLTDTGAICSPSWIIASSCAFLIVSCHSYVFLCSRVFDLLTLSCICCVNSSKILVSSGIKDGTA